MLVLLLMLFLAAGLVIVFAFLLGFRLGGQSWLTEVERVKAEGAAAQRQIHQLTRAAFVAMAEEAEARRSGTGK